MGALADGEVAEGLGDMGFADADWSGRRLRGMGAPPPRVNGARPGRCGSGQDAGVFHR
ncbi:hypothetical protein GCM10018966_068600 [Streptomyces yanii]